MQTGCKIEQVVNPATILTWAAETTSQGELTVVQGTQFASKCPKCDIYQPQPQLVTCSIKHRMP